MGVLVRPRSTNATKTFVSRLSTSQDATLIRIIRNITNKKHNGSDHNNCDWVAHSTGSSAHQLYLLQPTLVQTSQPWHMLPIPRTHPQVLHKGDVDGPHQRCLANVQEAPEKRGHVDEELQHKHSVGW